jgi:predicted nucleic acid-binding protein
LRTAVDSNVLLDVLLPSPRFRDASLAALERASAEGSLVVCEVVWAEAGGQFDSARSCAETFERVGVELLPSAAETAFSAGRAWVEYRRRGGRRDRVVADLMVGAHALHQADRLLTRDRGYYRTHFPRLRLWDWE